MTKIDRDRRIPVQVSEDEKREIETAADRMAMPTSTWVRWLALREARNGD